MGLLINTQHLILRELRADDADAIHKISNEPYVLKWLPHLKSDFAATVAFIKTSQAQYKLATDTYAHIYYGITLKGASELIGIVSLTNYKEAQNEIGINFFIAEEFSRQGYVTEAACALIKQSFLRLNLEKIIALTHFDNFVAMHMLDKIGFKKIGHASNLNSISGDTHPLDYYCLTQADFFSDNSNNN